VYGVEIRTLHDVTILFKPDLPPDTHNEVRVML
jgi:hypothetical protein